MGIMENKMKNIIFLMVLISTVVLGQENKIIRQLDLDTALVEYKDTVAIIISDSLSATSIGDADSLGGVEAASYLLKSDSTLYATQTDLAELEAGVLSDSVDALRIDVNSNTSDIATNETDITALETLADNKFYLGNGSNVATEVTLIGDVTSSNDGTMAIASGVIVNADVNASAAIDATKIADGSISNTEFQYLNGVSSNLQTQLDNLEVGTLSSLTDGTILIGDVTNEAQERTLSGDVTVTNAGVTSITALSIVDADINASAGITVTKIGAGTVDNTELGYLNGVTSSVQTQLTTNAGNISTNTTNIGVNADSITALRTDINDSDVTSLTATVATNSSTISDHSDSILTNATNIATNTSNISTNSSDIDDLESLANGKIYLGNGSNVATEITPSGDVTITNAGVTAISAGAIVNSDVNASADIDASKLGTGIVSNTEFNYLDGVTSAIQTQFSTQTDTSTAQRTDINALSNLAQSKIYIGNASGVATEQSVTGDIVISNDGLTTLQANSIEDIHVSAGADIDASKIGTGVVSDTEFNYLNGVTSAIQTQFDNLIVTDSIKARGGSWDWNILSPQSSEELLLKNPKYDVTIDSVTVVLIGSSTPSATFNIVHGGNLFSTAQTADEYSSTTISITSHNSYTTFSDATISAGDFMHLEVGTVSGTVNQMLITLFYTED